MLWAYWLLLLNRLSGVWHAPTVGNKELLRNSQWVQAGFWMLLAFITARAAIPELGVTREVVRAEELSGGGAWIGEPHRMLVIRVLVLHRRRGHRACHGIPVGETPVTASNTRKKFPPMIFPTSSSG